MALLSLGVLMSPWDADVPPLFPTGQRCPHRLYHSSVQPACRELWHLPCQLADGERGSLWGQESLSCVGQLLTPSCPQSKRIAGRIVPAIITTTAAVAGLACLEVYKLVWGCQDLSCYRNSNISLAACLLLRVQPPPAPTYRVGPSPPAKCRWGTRRGQWHLLWDNAKGTQGKGGGHAARAARAIALQKWIWVLQWVGNAARQCGTSSFPWLTLSSVPSPSFRPSCDALGAPRQAPR